jgi:hypothetical protein
VSSGRVSTDVADLIGELAPGVASARDVGARLHVNTSPYGEPQLGKRGLTPPSEAGAPTTR